MDMRRYLYLHDRLTDAIIIISNAKIINVQVVDETIKPCSVAMYVCM